MTDSSGFDKQRLAALLGMGGAEFLVEIITLFLETGTEKIEAIKEAISRADMNKLEFQAHALKSSAGNIGAVRLSELATELEHIEMDSPVESIRSAVSRIELEFSSVSELLEQELEDPEHA